MKPAGPVYHAFAVVAVSAWLLLAFAVLLVSRQLPFAPVWQTLRATCRRRHRGALTDLRPEQGHCYLASVPASVPSDADIGSRLVVLENGVPLAAAHSAHDDIRQHGGGRYSHWATNVYFATSDNSDPRTNGRAYTVEER